MSEEAQKHEASDINVRGTSWFAVALALSVVVMAFLVWRMEVMLDPKGVPWPHQPESASPASEAPPPALQSAPAEDLHILREREDRTLQNYTWVNRKEGVIRIPLDRARELILQRGLPATASTMPL